MRRSLAATIALFACAAIAAHGAANEPIPRLQLAWKASEISYHASVHLLADGTVALGFPHVGAWRDGKQLWKGHDRQVSHWMVELQDGSLLMAGQVKTVEALDPATGKPRWTATLPDDAPNLLVGTGMRAADGGVWLSVEDVVYRLDETACAAAKPCITPIKGVKISLIEAEGYWAADGGVLLVSMDSLEVLDKKGKSLTGHVQANHDVTAGVPLAGGKVLVNLGDGELVLLNPKKCDGRKHGLLLPDADGKVSRNCGGCKPAGKGCVVKRLAFDQVSGPVPLGKELLYTADGQLVLASAALKPKWSTGERKPYGRPVVTEQGIMCLCDASQGDDEEVVVGVCTYEAKQGKLIAVASTGIQAEMWDDGGDDALWVRGPWLLVRIGDRWRMYER